MSNLLAYLLGILSFIVAGAVWEMRYIIWCGLGFHDWWVFVGKQSYEGHEYECHRCKVVK